MVAFDTAKVERALRGPLGDEAARAVTETLAAGLTENVATKSDLELLGANLLKAIELQGPESRTAIAKSRTYSLRLAIAQIAITATIVVGGVAIATAIILNA